MSFSSAIINDNLVNAENQIPHASEDHISSELGNVDRDDQHPAETIQESHGALGNPRQTFEDGSVAAISTTTGQDQLLRPENQDPPSGEFSRPSSTLFQHQHPSLSALSTADEDISLSLNEFTLFLVLVFRPTTKQASISRLLYTNIIYRAQVSDTITIQVSGIIEMTICLMQLRQIANQDPTKI